MPKFSKLIKQITCKMKVTIAGYVIYETMYSNPFTVLLPMHLNIFNCTAREC